MYNTRKLVFFSLLVTVGAALHVFESMIPNPFPLPGVKFGLANIVTLITFYIYGFKEGMMVSFLRVIFGSFMGGTMFSFAFILSLSGAVGSSLVMGLLQSYSGSLSIVGVSIAGALTHNIVQLFMVSLLIQTNYIFYYLPYLLLAGIFMGFLTGYISRQLYNYLKMSNSCFPEAF